MKQIKTESTAQSNSEMVTWAEWWEQWGDDTFDTSSVLVDIEPVYGK